MYAWVFWYAKKSLKSINDALGCYSCNNPNTLVCSETQAMFLVTFNVWYNSTVGFSQNSNIVALVHNNRSYVECTRHIHSILLI
jgi:hypothetical protein